METVDKIEGRKKKAAINKGRITTHLSKQICEEEHCIWQKELCGRPSNDLRNSWIDLSYRGSTLSVSGKVSNRVLLGQIENSVDIQPRDHRSGFLKDLSCTDRISTLRIISGQSIGWNSSVYTNFLDYENEFNGVNRRTLRNLFRHYVVPE